MLFLGSAAFLHAQTQTAIIKEANGNERKVSGIQPMENGDLRFTDGTSNIQSVIRQGRYIWAWIPKPREVQISDNYLRDGDFAKAVEAYKLSGEKYKLVGWDVYCTWKQAEALTKENKKADAVKLLETLSGYKLVNPMLEKDLMESYRLLSTLYIDLGEISKAIPYLEIMSNSSDDSIASFAFIKKGDALAPTNKMDAALSYFQAALLFPESKDRPEALFKSAQMLRELKDARAEKFEEMLKKEYPSDPYTKQLK